MTARALATVVTAMVHINIMKQKRKIDHARKSFPFDLTHQMCYHFKYYENIFEFNES